MKLQQQKISKIFLKMQEESVTNTLIYNEL